MAQGLHWQREFWTCPAHFLSFYSLMQQWEDGKIRFGGGAGDRVWLNLGRVSHSLGIEISDIMVARFWNNYTLGCLVVFIVRKKCERPAKLEGFRHRGEMLNLGYSLPSRMRRNAGWSGGNAIEGFDVQFGGFLPNRYLLNTTVFVFWFCQGSCFSRQTQRFFFLFPLVGSW